ncbi:MAG: gamma carbonic anhydrase family protein [Methylococcaceae bacterium]|nr:gamma carbonic anhydrase family protein [Methylococcaceae bacterium]MCI0733556.1 gamma carbonic anhydrase family protein [Methylococcaceae bacterium]
MAIRIFKESRPRLGLHVYVDESAQLIGDVMLGDDVSFWPLAIARGDVASIRIGSRTNIQDGCLIHGTHQGRYSPEGFAVRIGKGVTVGHHAVIHGCSIGDLSLVGTASVVMDGAVVEDRVMIGAGSLVPPGKRLETGSLYLGSPVKRARSLTADELDMLEYSAGHYVRLKNEYLKMFDFEHKDESP